MKKASQFPSQIEEALIEALIKKYKMEPNVIEGALPEVAILLKQGLKEDTKKLNHRPFIPLTPEEEKARRESLQKLIIKIKSKRDKILRDEAIEALENIASIIEASPLQPLSLDKKTLTKLVKLVTGLSLNKKGSPEKKVIREAEPARIVTLLSGIKLNLTWDKKLISIEVEPKKLARRDKALAFVGIGKDTDNKVSLHHDEYLYGVPNND